MKNLICLIVVLLSAQPSSANTIVVNSLFDGLDTPSGASVTLREAVRDAAASPVQCRIEIVSAGPLEVDSPIVIPPGSMPILISNQNTGSLEIVPSDSFSGGSLFLVEDTRLSVTGIDFDLKDREITAFDVRGSTFVLGGCKIFNSRRRPVWVGAGTNILVRGCEFENLIGGALTVSGSSELDLEDSLFTSVTGTCVGVQPSATTGDISILNCTFAENVPILSSSSVVSISTSFDPDISIKNCSFVDNLMMPFNGPDSAEIDHTIFARNVRLSDPDTPLSVEENSFAGRGATSLGYNLMDSTSAVFDQAGDRVGRDVRISRLGHFGGSQRCCFPQAGSWAIDGGNGNRSSITPVKDVRGFERKAATSVINFPNTIDIGSVEANPSGLILVLNKNPSGPGSFKQALLDATEETNYIEFTRVAAQGVTNLDEEMSIRISGDTNININAHPSMPVAFSSLKNTRSLIIFNVDSGVQCDVSFQRFRFRDLVGEDFDTAKLRGAVEVNAVTGGKFSFHQCDFTDNVFGGFGALTALKKGTFILNECQFINNTVEGIRAWPARGGAAVQIVEDGSAEFRNCLFEGNHAERGGVAHSRLRELVGGEDRNGFLSFENCTFDGNSCDRGGACLYGDGISLERCTFAGSRGQAVISIPDLGDAGSRLEISRCLFYQNNKDSGNVDSVELDVANASEFALEVEGASWTDENSSYPGLFLAEHLGGSFVLGVLDSYSGQTVLKSRPLFEDSLPIIPESDFLPKYEYGLDGLWEFGQGSEHVSMPGTTLRFSRVLPGAMQRTIILPQAVVVSTSVVAGELLLNVEVSEGMTWAVFGGRSLSGLEATGQTFVGEAGIQELRIPIPAGHEKYFVQIRPE